MRASAYPLTYIKVTTCKHVSFTVLTKEQDIYSWRVFLSVKFSLRTDQNLTGSSRCVPIPNTFPLFRTRPLQSHAAEKFDSQAREWVQSLNRKGLKGSESNEFLISVQVQRQMSEVVRFPYGTVSPQNRVDEYMLLIKLHSDVDLNPCVKYTVGSSINSMEFRTVP